MRRGDFSEVLLPQVLLSGQAAVDPLGRPVRQNAIYDPRTTRLATDGSIVRDPFPNNTIPPEPMDPVSLKIQAMFPLPTNANLINNYQSFPTLNYSRATGVYTFSNQQSGLPWEDGKALSVPSPTGFNYASFLLGTPLAMNLAPVTNSRLGNHSFAAYIQDSWKVTRKLTLEYGLRYDFVTLLQEQFGRMQSADFSAPNPLVGGLPGAVKYEATCNCRFNRNYPYAFGPRFALAYQIGSDSKTVLRLGSVVGQAKL
jgi:outer membrane receptor protein involved in Fe transport